MFKVTSNAQCLGRGQLPQHLTVFGVDDRHHETTSLLIDCKLQIGAAAGDIAVEFFNCLAKCRTVIGRRLVSGAASDCGNGKATLGLATGVT